MEERLEQHLDSIDISKFKINADAIRQTYDFKKKHDPAFKNMTQSRFANMIGIGESTWKKIISKQASDAMCSTAWGIGVGLGLGMDVIFGTAPMPDFDREKLVFNPTLMDNMRRQIAAQDERIAAKNERIAELNADILKRDETINSLRADFLSVSRELASEKQKNADFPVLLSDLEKAKKSKHSLGVCLIISGVVIALFAAAMIYFIWELQNPHIGNWQY